MPKETTQLQSEFETDDIDLIAALEHMSLGNINPTVSTLEELAPGMLIFQHCLFGSAQIGATMLYFDSNKYSPRNTAPIEAIESWYFIQLEPETFRILRRTGWKAMFYVIGNPEIGEVKKVGPVHTVSSLMLAVVESALQEG